MSKQASKTVIGAFVVGAIALAVAGLLVFGSGRFFTQKNKYVLFFEGSVKGLTEGAPVMFHGVQIGQVTKIVFRFDPENLSVLIPVYIEIDTGKFTVVGGRRETPQYAYLSQLLDKGLKAQLQMQSFVTGLLMVNLDFFPDKPVRLVGIEKEYPEIPTIPSSMEELEKRIQNLPLNELADKLLHAVEGVDKLVNSPDVTESLASLNKTLKDANKLVNTIDAQAGPILSNLRTTSETARNALAEAEKALSTETGVPAELNETLKVARSALQQAEQTLSTFQGTATDYANLRYELDKTLKELSSSARSIRVLADYLERHPEAVIRGKSPSQGE